MKLIIVGGATCFMHSPAFCVPTGHRSKTSFLKAFLDTVGVMIIDTRRGGLIDTRALLGGLKSEN